MLQDNRYGENPMVKQEFGMQVSEVSTTVDARVLPPPLVCGWSFKSLFPDVSLYLSFLAMLVTWCFIFLQLKYHDGGREAQVAPAVGQWNMINKVCICLLSLPSVSATEIFGILTVMCEICRKCTRVLL